MTLVVALSYSLALTWFEADALHTKQLNAFAQHSQRAANMLALPLWNLDNEFLDMYFALLTDTPDILCAELRGEGISTRMHPPGCSTNPAGITFERDIQHGIDGNQQIIGQLRLSFALKDNRSVIAFIMLSRIPLALLALSAVFIFLFFSIRKHFFRPILQIVQAIDTYKRTNQRVEVNWHSQDEIGTLAEAFNDAQQQAAASENRLLQAKETAEAALLELQMTQSKLVEAEKMSSLGQLVAGMSHEIATPLGVARTAFSYHEQEIKQLHTQFLDGTLSKQQMQTFFEHIRESEQLININLQRAANLISSFKLVAADQSHDEIREIALLHYLQETLFALNPRLRQYKVALLLDCDEQLHIDSYPGAISQVITNLVMNSLLHAYSPMDNGTIRISAQQLGDDILLTYSDDGVGMNEATRKKAFDPFFTTKRGKGGTGLGLHIIYNLIVQKLHGSISLESAPQQGCKFSMVFPAHLRLHDTPDTTPSVE
jgi:two-component system, NtrC family, sensor kinase